MTFLIRAKVTGLKKCLDEIGTLKKALRGRILRKAMRAAGRVVLKAARRNLKHGHGLESGLLRKSLGVKVKIYRNSGVALALVGPRTRFKRLVAVRRGNKVVKEWRNPTKYAHLVELGTVHSAARPFLRPALTASAGGVREAVARVVEAELAKRKVDAGQDTTGGTS